MAPELYATRVMRGHILDFLSALYENYELYENCRHIPLGMQSAFWKGQKGLLDSKVLLATDC